MSKEGNLMKTAYVNYCDIPTEKNRIAYEEAVVVIQDCATEHLAQQTLLMMYWSVRSHFGLDHDANLLTACRSSLDSSETMSRVKSNSLTAQRDQRSLTGTSSMTTNYSGV